MPTPHARDLHTIERALAAQDAELERFEADVRAIGDVEPPDAFLAAFEEACEVAPPPPVARTPLLFGLRA